MSLDSALMAGRRAAESRMTSTATIWREDPANPVVVNGLETPGWVAFLITVPCWVDNSGPSSGTRTITRGSVEVQVATRVLKVPHDTTGLRDGDVAEIRGGACDGRFFEVVEATVADQKKQQELPVVEIQKPEGIA